MFVLLYYIQVSPKKIRHDNPNRWLSWRKFVKKNMRKLKTSESYLSQH